MLPVCCDTNMDTNQQITAVLLNPQARDGQAGENWPLADKILEKHGITFRMATTKRDGTSRCTSKVKYHLLLTGKNTGRKKSLSSNGSGTRYNLSYRTSFEAALKSIILTAP